PILDAMINAVLPLLTLTSAPASTSNRTISTRFVCAAYKSEVHPEVVEAFTLAPASTRYGMMSN
ncbi:hypothetical protein PHMEG_0004447, partial [Phytophthora megakarya]